jgi:anti-anti-sigma factor
VLYHAKVTEEDRSFRASSRPPRAAVVAFAGEFDIACKDELREHLDALVAFESLCLDLSHVEYVDSTAIGEWIRLHKQRLERGFDTEVVVVGDNQPIRRFLSILHLESLFRIERTVPPEFLAEPDRVTNRTIAVSDGALRAGDDVAS